ncbi:kinase-like protein [Rickenella mellea]|uniref:non-specific serine/threonine protein kinase n=1 Tax=Rickenella mellea TaxID=50990 RepID=A0A4Y7PJF0_9AGAM|nr:kinase-like protein [Rickenella mellea]
MIFSRLPKSINGAKSSRSASSLGHHLSTRPGQILGSRFEIVRQLGEGQHSTVWLATSDDGPKALKILTDDVTSLQGKEAFELEVLKNVASAQSTLRYKRLLQLEDHFKFSGEHGEHLCLVTEPLGPSLLNVQSTVESKRLPLPLVKHVTRQLLEALQVLHDQCHTVHTDIKLDNILFRIGPVSKNVEIKPAAFGDEDIVLIDFGTAMPHGVPHTRLIQPVALRCPEVITGCAWDCKADIWNLGCIVFELITGQHLFKPKAIASYTAEQYHLARIFGTFGTFSTEDVPQNMLNFFQHGQHFEKFFNSRNLKLAAAVEPLDVILKIYNVYTPELSVFLNAMLQILPDDRLSAKRLLSLDWLQ